MTAESILDLFGARRPAWQADARCAEYSTDQFFPAEEGSTLRHVAKAKAICAGCSVKKECLEYALENGEHFGVWGGTSERDRRALRRDRQGLVFPEEIFHGTLAGYEKHKRLHESPCNDCRLAHNRYRVDLRVERQKLPPTASHGTRSAYMQGCKCEPCRLANSEYMRKIRQRKKAV